MIVLDHATISIERHFVQTKSANDTMMGLMYFVGADEKVGRLYTDASGELVLAARNCCRETT